MNVYQKQKIGGGNCEVGTFYYLHIVGALLLFVIPIKAHVAWLKSESPQTVLHWFLSALVVFIFFYRCCCSDLVANNNNTEQQQCGQTQHTEESYIFIVCSRYTKTTKLSERRSWANGREVRERLKTASHISASSTCTIVCPLALPCPAKPPPPTPHHSFIHRNIMCYVLGQTFRHRLKSFFGCQITTTTTSTTLSTEQHQQQQWIIIILISIPYRWKRAPKTKTIIVSNSTISAMDSCVLSNRQI